MWWPFSPAYPERRPEEVDARTYDYVVVGGGTAGCVVASRLSEDPSVSVLVLERGSAHDSWMSRIPLVSSNILDPKSGAVTFESEPMSHCEGQRHLVFRGELLGGTSRVNAMVYTRGTAADFDQWDAMGHEDWSYQKVLPYFLKSETSLRDQKSDFHGNTGPWITSQPSKYSNWLFRGYQIAFQCIKALGYVIITDVNAANVPADGLALLDFTVNENKQRVSALDAFVPRKIALERERNLTICTKALVSQIVFTRDQKSPRAERVLFKNNSSKAGTIFSVAVNREVIVCSGAIGSPHILMLSGIGPREHLEDHGIKVVRNLPGVGSELADHFGIPVAWEVPITESLTHIATSPWKAAIEFLKYVLFGSGLLSIPVAALSLFIRSASLDDETSDLISVSPAEIYDKRKNHLPQDYIPDIELMTLAVAATVDMEEFKTVLSKIGVFSFLPTLMQPKSRGTVRLASSDASHDPKVDSGILSDPEDYLVARKAVRLALKIGDAMKSRGFPILRGVSVPKSSHDKEELDTFIRHRIRSTYHYASTCRMASEFDPKAPGVVDDELRVHGVQNLRVCDASVFPQITSSHLQAPVVMVAERCADMIKVSWPTQEI